MELQELHLHWDILGKIDPFWAILSDPHKKDGKWDIEEFFQTGEDWIARVMDYVESLGVGVSRHRALDFGCGAGRLTQPLCQYFAECHGVDIAESMIELANRYNKYGERCSYHLNKTADLRLFEDNTFDFVYSKIVLQHMEPQYSKGYIGEFIRVIAQGGLAIFQLPAERIPIETESIAASRSAAGGPLPDSGFSAQIAPAFVLQAGSQLRLNVHVRNSSDVIWPALGDAQGNYQIKLCNHWLDAHGTTVGEVDGLTVLPRDLPPGDQVLVPLIVTAPHKGGRYYLEIDLLQHGVGSFKVQGSVVYTYAVDVEGIGSESQESMAAIQMYGVPQQTVVELVRQHGGKVVDIQEDQLAGPHWNSYTYCISK